MADKEEPKKKQSTIKQIIQIFKYTHAEDKALPWLCGGVFVAPIVVFVVLGIVFLCGSSLVKYIPDENVYKIDSWVIETSELIAEASKKENPVILVDQEMYSSIRQYDPTVIEAVNNTEMARYMFTDTEELPVDGQYDDHSTAVSLFVKGVEVDASIMNEIFAERQVDFFVRNTRYYSAEYLQQLELTYVGAVDGYEVYRCAKE